MIGHSLGRMETRFRAILILYNCVRLALAHVEVRSEDVACPVGGQDGAAVRVDAQRGPPASGKCFETRHDRNPVDLGGLRVQEPRDDGEAGFEVVRHILADARVLYRRVPAVLALEDNAAADVEESFHRGGFGDAVVSVWEDVHDEVVVRQIDGVQPRPGKRPHTTHGERVLLGVCENFGDTGDHVCSNSSVIRPCRLGAAAHKDFADRSWVRHQIWAGGLGRRVPADHFDCHVDKGRTNRTQVRVSAHSHAYWQRGHVADTYLALNWACACVCVCVCV